MQILVVSTLQNPYSNLSKPKCKLNNVAVKPEKRIIATLNNHHYCYITGPNRQTGLVLIACLLDHSAVRLSLFNHLVSERNVWRHSLKKASSFSKKAKYLKTLLSLAHHQTRAVWTDWPQNWLTTKLTDHHYQPCTFTIGDKKKWGRLKLKRQSVKQNSCLPNDQLADRSPSSLLTKEKTSDISKQSSF